MAGSRLDRQCRLCHGPLGATWWETAMGERICGAHTGRPSCRSCTAPAAATPAGLCPRCTSTAVSTQEKVRSVLPRVRTGLHGLGLRLITPVRVRLATADELAALSGDATGRIAGCTVSIDTRVVDLAVLAGMPAPEFGAVVAHECMHAWMAQRGFGPVPAPIVEGLCQLVSDKWLQRIPDPRGRLLRAAIADDPDPVYGDGFRRVEASVGRHGLRAVLRAVRVQGALP
jgi:protein DA1